MTSSGSQASRSRNFRSTIPQSGWVEHDPEDIWATERRDRRATALAKAGVAASERRRHRHHQSARDDDRLGPRDRQADPSRDRLAGPAHRRRLRARCATRGARTAGHREDRPAARSVFLRHQDRLAARPCAGRARAGRARRARLRHGRHVPALAADRRQGRMPPTPPMPRARCCSTSTRGRWDDELAGAVRACRALLPEVHDCAGGIRRRRDPELFGGAIPIGGIAGDQQAATIGQACFAPGMVKSTYGTGCFVLLNTGDEAVRLAAPAADHDRLSARRQRTYALEGAIFIAGAAVQWLRDGLGDLQSADESRRTGGGAPIRARASIWCRRSSGWARRIGMPRRAARSSA